MLRLSAWPWQHARSRLGDLCLIDTECTDQPRHQASGDDDQRDNEPCLEAHLFYRHLLKRQTRLSIGAEVGKAHAAKFPLEQVPVIVMRGLAA